jgi:hypothetical protein
LLQSKPAMAVLSRYQLGPTGSRNESSSANLTAVANGRCRRHWMTHAGSAARGRRPEIIFLWQSDAALTATPTGYRNCRGPESESHLLDLTFLPMHHRLRFKPMARMWSWRRGCSLKTARMRSRAGLPVPGDSSSTTNPNPELVSGIWPTGKSCRGRSHIDNFLLSRELHS